MSDYKFEQIPASEITSKGVKALATRPNRPSQYGEGSLSAAALKQRFDDLAEAVIEKYNAMATILSGKDALKYLNLPSGYFWSDAQNPSIADLLTRIINGSGNVVAVDPVEKSVKDVSSIAESLYTLYTEVLALATSIKDDMLPTKQDNLSFDCTYNAETNKVATVATVTRKVAEIVANAPEDFDTLKELSDWLTSHEDSAASMNTAIGQNASDISEMKPAIEKNADDISVVTQKVNSLPDEITFAGLPDKPFDGTEAIDIQRVTNKGSVALKSGRKAYFQTDKTYTVDELIGAEVRYQNDNQTYYYTITEAMIVDSTADGVTVKVLDEYIFIAYTTNYTPSQANTPFTNVGVYFSEDSSGDYYIISLSKEGSVTKRLDGKFVKLYKHTAHIIGIYDYYGESVVSFYVSFVTSNPKPISTLQELEESPVCANGYLQVNYPRYQYYPSTDLGGMRDVHSVTISNGTLYVEFITAYTIPATTKVHAYNTQLTIKDTVTEV